MLSDDHKRRRADISRQLLDKYRANPKNVLVHVVTQDKTSVHHSDPETKAQNMQWKHQVSRPLRVTPSTGNVMSSVFRESKGIIMIDYLEKEHTATAEYYANELRRLHKEIKKKCRGKLRKGIWLLQDNTPAHTSQDATATRLWL